MGWEKALVRSAEIGFAESLAHKVRLRSKDGITLHEIPLREFRCVSLAKFSELVREFLPDDDGIFGVRNSSSQSMREFLWEEE